MATTTTTIDVATLADAQAQEQQLRSRAGELRLHGLLSRWAEVMGNPEQARWVAQLLGWEAAERHRRSLERRLRAAHIGPFKPLTDFDWTWPTNCDRVVVLARTAMSRQVGSPHRGSPFGGVNHQGTDRLRAKCGVGRHELCRHSSAEHRCRAGGIGRREETFLGQVVRRQQVQAGDADRTSAVIRHVAAFEHDIGLQGP